MTASTSETWRTELVDATARTVEALAAHHWPEWRLPRTFGGHAVGADVRADLIFTLGLLADAGVDQISGAHPDDLVADLLRGVAGSATHTFFSYRVAETLLRHGPFEGNHLLARCDDTQRAQVAEACDSSDWVELLDSGVLPRNYAAVLARCELARVRLGLADDESTLDSLLARVRSFLGANPFHMLDDSHERTGRYDIYSADVWLFCEPLAPRLGDLWVDGTRCALDLVAAVAGPDGAAIPWGRSTGVLAAALTVELAALALSREDLLVLPHEVVAGATEFDGRTRERAWVRRGVDATAAVLARFDPDGVVDAHRHRAQDRYRGTERRLQMTLDVLGKLAWAAAARRDGAEVDAASRPDAYTRRDELRPFEESRPAAVWTYRQPGAAFVLPFVGATRSHYLPAPHAPGTYEVPVDRDLPCWTPLVLASTGRFTAGGIPDRIRHQVGRVRAEWSSFRPSGSALEKDERAPLTGSRHATWTVEGRTLRLDDTLTFERPPDAVTLLVPETSARPLAVEVDCDQQHATDRIVVEGIPEWSSPFSGLAVVHQLDVEPATEIRWSVRVTPALRVVSTNHGHPYHDALYTPMGGRVVARPSPFGPLADPDAPVDAPMDLFHVHWPEWLAFDDLDEHRRIIATLADRGVPVVWTAHNLTPHEQRPDVYDPIYQAWADTADAVIHHSAWGEARTRARYRFRPDCRHKVIPHGHWGARWSTVGVPTRVEAEAVLGFPPTSLRIGIVGAPRADKRVRAALEGFAASSRADLQLACWSLALGETAPDDPRIVAASTYRDVSERAYATRLASCDLLLLPFDPEGDMLATGTVFDAVALGIPALVSDWGYLAETLGDAGIPAGHTAESITVALDALTTDVVAHAASAARARREALGWAPIAEQTLALFDRVVTGKP